MKRILILLLAALPASCFAQSHNEWRIHVRNGLLFNAVDVSTVTGARNVIITNTLTQAVGASLTRVTKSGLLLGIGVDAGYERYRVDVNYPFERYNFLRPAIIGAQYKVNNVIPYASLSLSAGYRLRRLPWSPEVRVGQVVHSPLASRRTSTGAYEQTRFGAPDLSFRMSGTSGKAVPGFGIELLNYAYLGCTIPVKFRGINGINAGIQLQRQLYMSSLNYIRIDYYNGYGNARNTDEFNGRHTTATIVLGVTF